MYGPDATFAGVPRADLDEPASFSNAGAVILGAPFDGGTSHRPGTRFGPRRSGSPITWPTTECARTWLSVWTP